MPAKQARLLTLSGACIFPFPLDRPAHHGASQDPPVPHRGVGVGVDENEDEDDEAV
jgi:hypothetical protein